MLNRKNRFIAWLCIITHLSWILPSFHPAHACEVINEYAGKKQVGRQWVQTVNKEDLTPSTWANPRPALINAPDLWEKTTASVRPILWETGVVPIFLASIIDGANPLYYFFAYYVGLKLFDHLEALQVGKVMNTCKTIISSQPDSSLMGLLAFALLFARGKADFAFPPGWITFNGGRLRNMTFKPSEVVHYTNETAPYLLGMELDKYLRLFIINEFSGMKNMTLWSIYQNNIINSILNSIGNLSFKVMVDTNEPEGGVWIWSTAEKITTFLSNLSFSGPPVPIFSQRFEFYSNPDSGYISYADRYFNPPNSPAPTAGPGSFNEWMSKWGPGVFWFSTLSLVASGVSYAYYPYAKRIIQADANEENIGDGDIEMLEREDDIPDFQSIAQELDQITNREMHQAQAWALIQKFKASLNHNDLFNVCFYIGNKHPCYEKALEIQANSLEGMLQEDIIQSSFLDSFLQKLHDLGNSTRRQDITWQYIQKYAEGIKARGARVLFDLCDVINKESHPKYADAVAIQAQCLMETLEQDEDAQSSTKLYKIKMEQEFRETPDKRRQDIILACLDHSYLIPELKIELCDLISADHPRYNQSLIHKAHLIWDNSLSSNDERFKQSMLILFKLPDDKDVIAIRQSFTQQFLYNIYSQEEIPEALLKFDPRDEAGLNVFKLCIQQKEDMDKQNAINSNTIRVQEAG